MSNEVEFDRALRLAGNFININLKFQLQHAFLPGQFIEADNLAQINETIFVYEGKVTRENAAIKQLQERHNSLKLFRIEYVKRGIFQDYKFIRLFYYSIKRKNIVEYSLNGVRFSSQKFYNINELAQLLRKL